MLKHLSNERGGSFLEYLLLASLILLMGVVGMGAVGGATADKMDKDEVSKAFGITQQE